MSKESDARKRQLKGEVDRKIAVRESVKRYNSKLDDIKFRVPKGERKKWKEFAAQNDTSLQQLIIGMMHDAMDKAGFDYTLPKEDER